MTDVKIKMDGLNALIKLMKKRPPNVEVGILAGSSREEGGSNAGVGAIHEFGTTTIPKRSFLREPLMEHLPKKVEGSGMFNPGSFVEVIKSKSFMLWANSLGKLGKEVVDGGFDSGGYGKWAPLAPSTYNRKQRKQILVETGQLKESISYRLSGNE